MPLRGRYGAVNGASSVQKWVVFRKVASSAIVASNTNGAEYVGTGNADWYGYFQSVGHTPLVMPNDTFTFTGAIGNGYGVTGQAIVQVARIDVPLQNENGESAPIVTTVKFLGNGALSHGSVSVTDSTSVAYYSAVGRKVSLGTVTTSPVFTDYCSITKATLVFAADNENGLVTACDNGVVKRYAGNITAKAGFVAVPDKMADLPTPDTFYAFRLYVTASAFWDVRWMKCAGIDDFTVDNNGAWVSAKPNFEFSSRATNVTERAGKIIKPDTTQWWP